METLIKKKILFVITKSNWGGAQRYVYDLATSMAKAGATIKVAYGGTGEADATHGALAHNLRQAGIQSIFVKSFMRDISFLREFSVLRDLILVFKTERPDVVHLNSSKAGGIGALAGRIAGIKKIVFTSHGLAYDEDRGFFIRLFRLFATWVTFLLVHQVILISHETYERARQFPFCQKKLHLIYNGIVPEALEPRSVARARLVPDGNSNVPWIGTISELTLNKGIPFLIEAARLLKERGKIFELVIIGFGEDYEIFCRLVAKYGLNKYVHLLGFVGSAARYLLAFDIFTLTSLKEGHPYVLLEAAQAHCAVVGSRIPGITDMIDADTGILVEPKNPQNIAEALEFLLDNAQKREELGHAFSKRVRERFSIEKMIAQTLETYR